MQVCNFRAYTGRILFAYCWFSLYGIFCAAKQENICKRNENGVTPQELNQTSFFLVTTYVSARETTLKAQLDKLSVPQMFTQLYSCSLLLLFALLQLHAVTSDFCVPFRNHVKPQPCADVCQLTETLSGTGSPQPPCTPTSDTTPSTLTPLSEQPASPRENHHLDLGISSRARSVFYIYIYI